VHDGNADSVRLEGSRGRAADVALGKDRAHERLAGVEIVLDDLILLDRRGGANVPATDDADSGTF
jgi:hypothetical protein